MTSMTSMTTSTCRRSCAELEVTVLLGVESEAALSLGRAMTMHLVPAQGGPRVARSDLQECSRAGGG